MNIDDFDKVVENRISKIRSILAEKAKQYADPEDRLLFFKQAGTKRYITPERALRDMASKQDISIDNYVNELPKNCRSLDQWDEKIGDAINYLILLEALIRERIDDNSL